MPRILVALDDSPGSEKALEVAVRLAQQDGGCVTAVTVLEQPGTPAVDGPREDDTTQSRRRLQDLLQTAANFARSRGVRLTPVLREGDPADSILSCAQENQASLLVVGANSQPEGACGLGDIADEVSNHSPCAVLIAR